MAAAAVIAQWRSTVPQGKGVIDVGFTLPHGGVLRLRLDATSSGHLMETLALYLERVVPPARGRETPCR